MTRQRDVHRIEQPIRDATKDMSPARREHLLRLVATALIEQKRRHPVRAQHVRRALRSVSEKQR